LDIYITLFTETTVDVFVHVHLHRRIRAK